MECESVPDPATTPAAHGTTLAYFYGCGGLCVVFALMMLYSKCRKFRWFALATLSDDQESSAWKSDLLYTMFFVLSAGGYLLAAVSTQVYPAANWGIQTSKVFIILAWTCPLAACCGAVQAMCTRRCLKGSVWLLGLASVCTALVEVAIPGDRHFQGFMWCLTALTLVCAFAWAVVPFFDTTKDPCPGAVGNNPCGGYRSFFYILAMTSHMMVAIWEPDCGYAAHPVCYDSCGMAPGFHFVLALIFIVPFYVSVIPFQCYPFPVAFPKIPSCLVRTQPEEDR